MAEQKQKILETVLEDIKGTNGTNPNFRSPALAKVRKKRRVGGGVTSKHKHFHKRVVTAEVSSNILDKIKEESDVSAEAVENGVKTTEPKMKINKILVRTPVVGTENGADRPDSDLNGEDNDSKETANAMDKTKSKQASDENSPPKAKGLDREVSFGNKSEHSATPDKSPSRRNKRPMSSRKFTKEDLELFLPRKSFFNSHDKILIEAGHQVDTHKERKKPNWRAILKMHTMDELYPVKKEEPTDEENLFGPKDDDTESEDEIFNIEKTETLISKEGTKKSRSKQSAKRSGNPEREEYKPLYEYLKYIHENPDEYVALTKFTTKNVEYKHPNTLVRMGRIFRRGSNVRNSIYLHALCGLKSNSLEQTNAQEESEIVKLKTKAEAWMKGLTTQQYLKAKDLALKDVGEEDISYTKWWLAFKSCQYLRVPTHVTPETT